MAVAASLRLASDAIVHINDVFHNGSIFLGGLVALGVDAVEPRTDLMH
jgi:hypothetical protein